MQNSKLLISFEEEIKRKGYRNESIKNYVSCVTKFLYHFKDKDSPKHINESDIKNFLSQFKEHNTQRGLILGLVDSKIFTIWTCYTIYTLWILWPYILKMAEGQMFTTNSETLVEVFAVSTIII